MPKELPTTRSQRIIAVPTLQESQMLLALLEQDLRRTVTNGCPEGQEWIRIQQALLSLLALWREASDHALSAHMQSFAGYLIRCLERAREGRCRHTTENMRQLTKEVHTAWDPMLQGEPGTPSQGYQPEHNVGPALLSDLGGART